MMMGGGAGESRARSIPTAAHLAPELLGEVEVSTHCDEHRPVHGGSVGLHTLEETQTLRCHGMGLAACRGEGNCGFRNTEQDPQAFATTSVMEEERLSQYRITPNRKIVSKL